MATRHYRRLNADDLKRRWAADEFNTMSDRQYRQLEDRQRAKAARMGLRLRKARTRDPSASEYGTYCIVDASTNGTVAGGGINGYGLGLDEVIQFLSEWADQWADQ
jgi:hypothetical protein